MCVVVFVVVFVDHSDFSDYSVYDVADTMKMYFRELPDPLLTSKFSELLITLQESECGRCSSGWSYTAGKGSCVRFIFTNGVMEFDGGLSV